MNIAQISNSRMVIPSLVIPHEIGAWALGFEENHEAAKQALAPFEFGKFWVTDASSELHLTGIRESFNKSRSRDGRTVLHFVLEWNDKSHEADELFRILIGLGLDPDVADFDFLRPSHCCGRVDAARILSSCRPNLQASTMGGSTPEDCARVSTHGEPMKCEHFVVQQKDRKSVV